MYSMFIIDIENLSQDILVKDLKRHGIVDDGAKPNKYYTKESSSNRARSYISISNFYSSRSLSHFDATGDVEEAADTIALNKLASQIIAQIQSLNEQNLEKLASFKKYLIDNGIPLFFISPVLDSTETSLAANSYSKNTDGEGTLDTTATSSEAGEDAIMKELIRSENLEDLLDAIEHQETATELSRSEILVITDNITRYAKYQQDNFNVKFVTPGNLAYTLEQLKKSSLHSSETNGTISLVTEEGEKESLLQNQTTSYEIPTIDLSSVSHLPRKLQRDLEQFSKIVLQKRAYAGALRLGWRDSIIDKTNAILSFINAAFAFQWIGQMSGELFEHKDSAPSIEQQTLFYLTYFVASIPATLFSTLCGKDNLDDLLEFITDRLTGKAKYITNPNISSTKALAHYSFIFATALTSALPGLWGAYKEFFLDIGKHYSHLPGPIQDIATITTPISAVSTNIRGILLRWTRAMHASANDAIDGSIANIQRKLLLAFLNEFKSCVKNVSRKNSLAIVQLSDQLDLINKADSISDTEKLKLIMLMKISFVIQNLTKKQIQELILSTKSNIKDTFNGITYLIALFATLPSYVQSDQAAIFLAKKIGLQEKIKQLFFLGIVLSSIVTNVEINTNSQLMTYNFAKDKANNIRTKRTNLSNLGIFEYTKAITIGFLGVAAALAAFALTADFPLFSFLLLAYSQAAIYAFITFAIGIRGLAGTSDRLSYLAHIKYYGLESAESLTAVYNLYESSATHQSRIASVAEYKLLQETNKLTRIFESAPLKYVAELLALPGYEAIAEQVKADAPKRESAARLCGMYRDGLHRAAQSTTRSDPEKLSHKSVRIVEEESPVNDTDPVTVVDEDKFRRPGFCCK